MSRHRNPPHLNAARRRAKKRVLADRDGAWCTYCGKLFADLAQATIDHVAPLSLFKTWATEHLVLACKPCNATKANRFPLLLALLLNASAHAHPASAHAAEHHAHATPPVAHAAGHRAHGLAPSAHETGPELSTARLDNGGVFTVFTTSAPASPRREQLFIAVPEAMASVLEAPGAVAEAAAGVPETRWCVPEARGVNTGAPGAAPEALAGVPEVPSAVAEAAAGVPEARHLGASEHGTGAREHGTASGEHGTCRREHAAGDGEHDHAPVNGASDRVVTVADCLLLARLAAAYGSAPRAVDRSPDRTREQSRGDQREQPTVRTPSAVLIGAAEPAPTQPTVSTPCALLTARPDAPDSAAHGEVAA